jgi:hypothetical protein
MLELLIDKGADANIINKAGVTPLAASGYGDRLGGVLYNRQGRFLLKHGADPGRSSVSGAESVRPGTMRTGQNRSR